MAIGKIVALLRPEKIIFKGDDLADCAFRIHGGFGDHLIAARYIRDLCNEVGGLTFDIYTSYLSATEWIFKNLPGFQNTISEDKWPSTIDRYAARIGLTDYVYSDGTPRALRTQSRNIRQLLHVIEVMNVSRREIRNLGPFIQNHPYMSNFLASTVSVMGFKRHNFMHAMSGIKYSDELLPLDTDAEVHSKFGLPKGAYITIADSYNAAFHAGHGGEVKSTKSYPHYEGVIAAIKERLPEIFIIQVGKDVGRPMKGVDLMLLNKTNLAELASILKKSRLHIDNESGLAHLATNLGVETCVIFGPTPVEYFGYKENINITPPVCGDCYWIKENWMTDCPRGYDEPRCLTQQPPKNVVDQIAFKLKMIAEGI